MLQIHQVSRFFGDYHALKNVSFTILSGEFFTLLGPSGCGKTTLLRLIAGFDQPNDGDILLDGQSLLNISAEKRPIHTVFQNYALFPHLTIAENIAFPLKMAKVDGMTIDEKVKKVLSKVLLWDKANRYPHELSGGQKQRIALARSIVNEPRILLLDEPLGALDAKIRSEMQRELKELQSQLGITFIFVTHSQEEALSLSHRIAVMNQGKIEQLDQPHRLYNFPNNRFVAEFIGNINLLPEPLKNGFLAIRPERFHLSPLGFQVEEHNQKDENKSQQKLTGVIENMLYTGYHSTFHIRLHQYDTTLIEVLQTNKANDTLFEIGQTVSLSFAQEDTIFIGE